VEGVLAGCDYIKQLSGVLFLLFCLSSDTSSLRTELPEIRVKCDPAQVFLVKALVDGHPTFSYHLDISPTTVSLSRPSDFDLQLM
jgi:hypothetical protein